MSHHLARRHFLALGMAFAGAGVALPLYAQQQRPRVAVLFAGLIDDRGFMEAGYRGLVAARESTGAETTWIDKVQPQQEPMIAALRQLAAQRPALVIAHGGQNNEAARIVAAENPDIKFVVTQGSVTGPNLASYEVLQEESAFLAGALAGWSTRTGTVGHMSGIRVTPGLKGRAAFANGVTFANPTAKLLTNFSGNQDDNMLSKRVASAMIDAKADIIFTMLNAGRAGAIDACRERDAKQIGNVRDWVAAVPDVFIASAVADSGIALKKAVEDLVSGSLKFGAVERIGLNQPDAVRLTLSASVPAAVRERIDALAARIKSGAMAVSTDWTGPEFPNPA